MLVILRVTIGWHFLYEGVWKIVHADLFSAQPFLTQAKGPAAPLFHAMIPDLDGRQRLALKEGEDDKGNTVYTSEAYASAWTKLNDDVVADYALGPEQTAEADKLLKVYLESLQVYLTENRDEIKGHFGSLDRLAERKAAGANGAEHQKKRIWDEQQKLRSEVKGWLGELDGMGEEFRMALWDILDDDQKSAGQIQAAVTDVETLPVELPFAKTWTDLLDLSITYGLTAIGLCLLIGFCTRLAALGGVAFLISVLLTQPPIPTIYPPAPEVVGHALVVDKNFVEMIALLVLASTAVGRWGGLDSYLYGWLGRPIMVRFGIIQDDEDED